MILHIALQWQQRNINQILNSQKTSHTSPSRASYEVPVVRIRVKIDRVITLCIHIWCKSQIKEPHGSLRLLVQQQNVYSPNLMMSIMKFNSQELFNSNSTEIYMTTTGRLKPRWAYLSLQTFCFSCGTKRPVLRIISNIWFSSSFVLRYFTK